MKRSGGVGNGMEESGRPSDEVDWRRPKTNGVAGNEMEIQEPEWSGEVGKVMEWIGGK